MVIERTGGYEETAETKTNQEVDKQPELVTSAQRKHEHTPDAYPTGYDPAGETRIGIGTAKGDVGRLVRMNEGRHYSDGNHSAREAARDKKRITQSLCSSLKIVTPYQQSRAVSAMSQMNLDNFGQQKRIEKVALSTIGVIVDRERRHYFLNGTDPTKIDFSDIGPEEYPDRFTEEAEFQEVRSDYDISKDDHYSVTRLVKEELTEIGYFNQEDQPLY